MIAVGFVILVFAGIMAAASMVELGDALGTSFFILFYIAGVLVYGAGVRDMSYDRGELDGYCWASYIALEADTLEYIRALPQCEFPDEEKIQEYIETL